jgi:hypothetical protein
VAEAGADVEDTHAGRDSGLMKEQTRCRFEPGSLAIESYEFGRFAAQYILGFLRRLGGHRCEYIHSP